MVHLFYIYIYIILLLYLYHKYYINLYKTIVTFVLVDPVVFNQLDDGRFIDWFLIEPCWFLCSSVTFLGGQGAPKMIVERFKIVPYWFILTVYNRNSFLVWVQHSLVVFAIASKSLKNCIHNYQMKQPTIHQHIFMVSIKD